MSVDDKVEILVSIVIVNYNGLGFLEPCIDSIVNKVTVPFEIIIVDNASSDGSVEFIRNKFPEIKLIASSVNNGFAVGNNIGAQFAHGKYILLLNNDTELMSDIKPSIELLEAFGDIGIVGAKMYGRNGEVRKSAGSFPKYYKLILLKSLYKINGCTNDVHIGTDFYEVDWVEGSFLLTRKYVWDRLGGLDEKYFMYGEDTDFCKSVIKSGLKVGVLPTVSYVHYGGYAAVRFTMLIRGFRRYHEKFSNRRERFAANVILSVGLVVRGMVYGLMGLFGDAGAKEKAVVSWKALRESPW